MDYFQILNLQREPFSNSPEPDFFFQSDLHLACLQKLELAVRLRRGLNVVMGEVGTGKTTLCRQLILNFSLHEEDREKIEAHLILDPSFSDAREFLAFVALLFGAVKSADGKSDWQLKEEIKNYLFNRGVSEGRIVVLLIDEGQKLPDYCLEVLREFLNYETNEYKLLQIVIFAQKEFDQTLRTHQNFADRVNQYYLLKPLNFKNSVKMIRFRLARAGADPQAAAALFTRPALWAIYRATGGYPRRIVTLSHQAMLATIIQNRARAGYFLVMSCARRIFVAQAASRRRWALASMGGALFLMLALLSHGNIGWFAARPERAVREAPAPVRLVTVTPPQAEVFNAAKEGTRGEEAALSYSSSLPAEETLFKKKPDMLGQLVVKRNDYVLKMMEKVYGRDAVFRLEAVARANTHIRDIDRVRRGDVINIPARPGGSNPLPRGKYWAELALLDNLGSAYELADTPGLPPLVLLPQWNERDGIVFAVIMKEGFATEEAALSAVKELPAHLASRARILQGWPEGTIFL